jgi:hypothetical protein
MNPTNLVEAILAYPVALTISQNAIDGTYTAVVTNYRHDRDSLYRNASLDALLTSALADLGEI